MLYLPGGQRVQFLTWGSSISPLRFWNVIANVPARAKGKKAERELISSRTKYRKRVTCAAHNSKQKTTLFDYSYFFFFFLLS